MCEYSLTVKLQLPKLALRVRFPLFAPVSKEPERKSRSGSFDKIERTEIDMFDDKKPVYVKTPADFYYGMDLN